MLGRNTPSLSQPQEKKMGEVIIMKDWIDAKKRQEYEDLHHDLTTFMNYYDISHEYYIFNTDYEPMRIYGTDENRRLS